MPRYRTISRWLDKETGNYVDPPTEMDLEEERGERLRLAGCVTLISEAPPKGEGRAPHKKAGSTGSDAYSSPPAEADPSANDGGASGGGLFGTVEGEPGGGDPQSGADPDNTSSDGVTSSS